MLERSFEISIHNLVSSILSVGMLNAFACSSGNDRVLTATKELLSDRYLNVSKYHAFRVLLRGVAMYGSEFQEVTV
jgi:hypothetical protein